MRRLGYRPELDGIRGIAISLVVIDHYFGLHEGGSSGVRLFFVLSGFLITTLLLEEHATTGSVKLGAFYRRRARRLLPALGAMLLVYLGFQAGHLGVGRAAERVALAGSYVSNFAVAFHVHDVITGTALGPLWSLAQEEQFYAVWPLLLLAGIRSRRLLGYLLVAIVGLLVYERVLAYRGASVVRLYYGPDTNPVWLLGGAALAVLRRRGMRVPTPIAVLGFVCAGWNLAVANLGWPWVGPTFSTLLLLSSYTAIVGGAWSSSGAVRTLSLRPVVWLGAISYSVYLWQIVAVEAGHSFGIAFGLNATEWRLLAIPLVLAIASLSHRFVERPFRVRRAPSRQLSVGAVPAAAD